MMIFSIIENSDNLNLHCFFLRFLFFQELRVPVFCELPKSIFAELCRSGFTKLLILLLDRFKFVWFSFVSSRALAEFCLSDSLFLIPARSFILKLVFSAAIKYI